VVEGTLIGRTDTEVIISVKGRRLSIPRSCVTEVRLPKSKVESSDKEILKLV
jgi:hypothetical protein